MSSFLTEFLTDAFEFLDGPPSPDREAGVEPPVARTEPAQPDRPDDTDGTELAAEAIYSLDGAVGNPGGADPAAGSVLEPAAALRAEAAPPLPAFLEGFSLPSGLINGMFEEDIFVGNGSSTFLVSLIDALSEADYANTLGAYEVDAAGNIVDVRLLVLDTKASPDAQVGVFGVDAGHELGFFLVSGGADWAKSLATDDTLSFIDAAGAPANLSDGASIRLAVNGSAVAANVFHNLSSSLNADGRTHVVSGTLDDVRTIIAFEDQLDGGDRDYQDVVFQVDDALFV